MKQHITVEQIRSLPDEKLKKLFYTHFKDCIGERVWIEGKYIHCDSLYVSIGNFSSYMKIGKMIEILEQNCEEIEIYNDYDANCDNQVKWWTVEYSLLDTIAEKLMKELCDALFEAIKEIL